MAPTGLASRFDNGNPHGFSGFVEANLSKSALVKVIASRCFLCLSTKKLI